MINLEDVKEIIVYSGVADLRKGISGLITLVGDVSDGWPISSPALLYVTPLGLVVLFMFPGAALRLPRLAISTRLWRLGNRVGRTDGVAIG